VNVTYDGIEQPKEICFESTFEFICDVFVELHKC